MMHYVINWLVLVPEFLRRNPPRQLSLAQIRNAMRASISCGLPFSGSQK